MTRRHISISKISNDFGANKTVVLNKKDDKKRHNEEKYKQGQPNQLISLRPWEEYNDTPTEIKKQEDHTDLFFRNHKVLRIPAEYIDGTKEIKGKKIAILATDIPGKEIIIKEED